MASGSAQATLPWSWYSDPELLRHEQERIFRAWQYVAPVEHVAKAGDFSTCSVGDVPVVVTRDGGGEPHALLNVCRHRGSLAVAGNLFPEDVPETEVDEQLAFDDQVGLEDRALVESVQAGVRSGLIDEGRLLPESERPLAHFHGFVREARA